AYDQALRWWDLERGNCRQVLKGHTCGVSGVALSADGRRALSGAYDQTLRWWDLDRGECRLALHGHTDGGPEGGVGGDGRTDGAVGLRGAGRRALSGSADRTLRWWDLDRWGSHLALRGHSGGVNGVALSGDGRRALSGSDDGTLRWWDLDRGESRRALQGHTD